MIKKVFTTSDGVVWSSMRLARRYDARRALEAFLRENLRPAFDSEGLETVEFTYVMDLCVHHADRIKEFSDMRSAANLARDFDLDEVQQWVQARMVQEYMKFGQNPIDFYSPSYINQTVHRVWTVLIGEGAADGRYSDLQCELSQQALKEFSAS